ncbi:MAG: 4-alpha-glucanotransferase [Saprospiraceae bacterium]|nr:4-alpha-glucanotransferase [Saprospiraceae bacterium]
MYEITFQTVYQTKWGQQVVVVGNISQLGGNDPAKGLRLQHVTDGLWSVTVSLASSEDVLYRYAVIDEEGNLVDEEWGLPRSLPNIDRQKGQIFLREGWRARRHPENAFYNSAFLKVLFRQEVVTDRIAPVKFKSTFQFEIAVPRSFGKLQVCVLGNIEALGNWDFQKPLLLDSQDFPVWQRTIEMPGRAIVQYKYGFYDSEEKRVSYLEEGPNRQFSTYSCQGVDRVVLRDTYFRHRQPLWKSSGVAIPVFSLRTKNNFGVGAFSDLKVLVDWAKIAGLKLVQILPINDTSATNTWSDSYPYSSISVFALHPQYLDLSLVDDFEDVIDQKEYRKNQKQLNTKPDIDYLEMMDLKLKYARKLFEFHRNRFPKTKAYKEFLDINSHWLQPYALFCALRDYHGTPDFTLWKEHAVFSEEFLQKLTAPRSKFYSEVLFYCYLQFLLDNQLHDVAQYARSEGIILKGDIAIGIYRDSADAWTLPQLFDMRSQAGAPPDPFSDLGQNWGFPTYRWEIMAQNGYAWWQHRLQNLSRYFDAFRIDHILGFFRIWQIPYAQIQGVLGFFNPALPVTLEEFEERSIPFDQDRFCQPYVTDAVLLDLFGKECEAVTNLFFDRSDVENYQFKIEFDNQRKLYQYFKNYPEQINWRDRLFQLHAEVLFIPDHTSTEQILHPRIDFQKTFSFKALPTALQAKLEDLYVDYFYRRQEEFWRTQGLTKLPAIKNATDMLICGEDLGMIPACVPEVMKELDLLTLEIQRMSKNPRTEFLQEDDIPYLSVCSTSTHDMSPIRGWWLESEDDYKARFYSKELHLHGLPPEDCTNFIAEQIISQHIQWPGMWTIFPIQDLLAMSDSLRRKDPMEERINIPANPNHHWQYRLHINLEELLKADDFNHHLKSLLKSGGR